MALTNAGRDFIAGRITGTAGTSFDNTNARIAVGSSTTAFAASQTALVTELGRKAMDATYPTTTGNVLVFRSTFATGDANGAWNEWGVLNAGAAGTLLNRVQEALGTKTSAQTWQFTVTLTINAA
jgi:hypothetical protein